MNPEDISGQKRRSNAFVITSNKKKIISEEAGITDTMKEEEKIEKVTNVLEADLKRGNNLQRHLGIKQDNIIDIPPPKYLDFKKEYYTKNEKVNKYTHEYMIYIILFY